MKNLNFHIIAAFLVNVTLKGSSQARFYLEHEFIFTVDCVESTRKAFEQPLLWGCFVTVTTAFVVFSYQLLFVPKQKSFFKNSRKLEWADLRLVLTIPAGEFTLPQIQRAALPVSDQPVRSDPADV